MSDENKENLGFILLIIGYVIVLLDFWIGLGFILLFLMFSYFDSQENINNDNVSDSIFTDILFYMKWGIIIFIFTFPFLHFFLEF